MHKMSNPYNDPILPDYVKSDLLRLMNRVSANEHWYRQSWLGVPVWQMGDDMLRLQEVVSEIKPQWIVETGTKFGGSAIFFASLQHLLNLNEGGVITVDLTQYPEAVENLRTHTHAGRVKAALLGDAAAPETVAKVRQAITNAASPTLVFLDDNHNADHVYREMTQYAPLVTVGSYLIVADTVFEDLAGTPVGTPTDKYPDVARSNPRVAVERFLAERDDFVRDMRFVGKGIGNFNDGFLRKVK